MQCTFLLSTLTLSKLMKFFFYTAVLRLIFLTYNLYQFFFFNSEGQVRPSDVLALIFGMVSGICKRHFPSVFTVVQCAPWTSALDTKEIIYLTLGCSEFFILGIMWSMCCLDAKLHSTVLTRILKNKWRNGWCTRPEKSFHLLVQSLLQKTLEPLLEFNWFKGLYNF